MSQSIHDAIVTALNREESDPTWRYFFDTGDLATIDTCFVYVTHNLRGLPCSNLVNIIYWQSRLLDYLLDKEKITKHLGSGDDQ